MHSFEQARRKVQGELDRAITDQLGYQKGRSTPARGGRLEPALAGVDFVSMEDSIDTSTPAGRFTFHVIAAVAELEKELIRERTRAGIAAARRRGAHVGRPRLDVDIDQARSLRGVGASLRTIAKSLGVGLGTIHDLLRVQKTSSEPALEAAEITRAA